MKPGWLASGQRPAVLETYTTLVVQALEMGIVVPLDFLTGVLLLNGNAWGYALASIVLIKVTTLGTAVLSMALFIAPDGGGGRAGTDRLIHGAGHVQPDAECGLLQEDESSGHCW